jgi:putative addiction module component (TIGR02574 family)
MGARVEAHAFQCYDSAMNSNAIEQSALRLPKPDRARLVHLLLDSLDDPSDTDIQALWLNAAKRRADEIDNGKVKLVSGEDLERQVQALFK